MVRGEKSSVSILGKGSWDALDCSSLLSMLLRLTMVSCRGKMGLDVGPVNSEGGPLCLMTSLKMSLEVG